MWQAGQAQDTLQKYGQTPGTAVHFLLALLRDNSSPPRTVEVPEEYRNPSGTMRPPGEELYGLHYWRLGLSPTEYAYQWELPPADTLARKLIDQFSRQGAPDQTQPTAENLPTLGENLREETNSDERTSGEQVETEMRQEYPHDSEQIDAHVIDNASLAVSSDNLHCEEMLTDSDTHAFSETFDLPQNSDPQISYAPLAMDESTAPSPIKEARAYSEMEDEPLDELNSLLDADMPVTPVFSFKRSPNKRPKRLMLQEEEPSSDEETESVRPRNPQTIRQAPDRRHTADNRKRRKTYNHEKTNKLHQLLSRFRDDPTCSNAVQELVEDGADPDCLCAAGNRPLHYAAYHKRIPLIRSLIDHGADYNALSAEGESILYWAALGGVASVRCLLDYGVSIEVQNDQMERVIHYCEHFSLKVLKELVRAGANINARDNNKNTPLHFLCYIGDERTELAEGALDKILYLIRKGANIHARNNDGETPLNMLERKRLRRIVAVVEREANINYQQTSLRESGHEIASDAEDASEAQQLPAKAKGKERVRIDSSDADSDSLPDSPPHPMRRPQTPSALPKVGPKPTTIQLHEFISPPESWDYTVSSYASGLDDVPCNVGRISLSAPAHTRILRVKEPWYCVEVREVPDGHPLKALPGIHRGLFATCDIPAGIYLCEYAGELVSSLRELTPDDRYSMSYDEDYDVDARFCGNESRFINAAYKPIKLGEANVSFLKVIAEDGLRILVYTRRRIRKGMEVLADYGNGYEAFFSMHPQSKRAQQDTHAADDDEENDDGEDEEAKMMQVAKANKEVKEAEANEGKNEASANVSDASQG